MTKIPELFSCGDQASRRGGDGQMPPTGSPKQDDVAPVDSTQWDEYQLYRSASQSAFDRDRLQRWLSGTLEQRR